MRQTVRAKKEPLDEPTCDPERSGRYGAGEESVALFLCGNFLTDMLRSTIALADSSGTLQTQYGYDPFGNATVSGAANPDPYEFTGRENDGTGLYYYRARYYSPSASRFLSEDPLGLRGGINFYAYVANSPINRVDPTGLQACGGNCTNAPPLPSNSPQCDNYGNETYLWVSMKCFCQCAGDSPWAQQVRGCLACEYGNGTNRYVAHETCYNAAGWAGAPWGVLFGCSAKCFVGFWPG